jgi:hypothetical protein
MNNPPRIDRRLAIKWMLAAGAGTMMVNPLAFAAAPGGARPISGKGYGTDPDLVRAYKPGDFWPLTLGDGQRRDVAALCDIIIPAEGDHPSASSVGVTDFVDEWVSAPYPDNVRDRPLILDGLAWVASASQRQFGTAFADATDAQRLSLCEEMAPAAEKGSPGETASKFFRRMRNLVSAGYFSTPPGMKDLGYVGNVPSATFDGPPADLVAKLGLTDEVRW